MAQFLEGVVKLRFCRFLEAFGQSFHPKKNRPSINPKSTCRLLLIAAAAVCTRLSAAPVGNPSAPKIIREGLFTSSDSWVDFRLGYEGDFVADGKMQQANQQYDRVDTYQQWTHSGTFTFNILDRIDLYGVLGSSQTKTDWRASNAAAGTISRIQIKTHYSFLWGAGGRIIAYEWTNASIGFGGRYATCSYNPMQLSTNGILINPAGAYFKWRQWQLNLDASYQINLFTPYIGIKYSNAKATLKNFQTPISANLSGSSSLKNRVPIGLYIGCSLSNGKYFMLNLEARLIDEEAVTVSGDFRF